jgi:hypothetical protein
MTERAGNGRNWRRLATAGVGLCGLATLAGTQREGSRFSERSLAGTWSYVGNGGILVPPAAPEPTPAATVGQFTFDGEGGCSARGMVNVLGATVETETTACSYSVEPDGRGFAEATFTNAPISDPFPFTLVIADGGRELYLMNTQYVVGTLIAKRR